MQAWLAVAGVLPAALVSKWSCLPLPRLAKAGQDGLRTGKYNSREWSQVQIHARRVLHPAAFPAARQRRKKEMDKTDLSVLHKHIKEVPTTMAVSL